MIQFVGAMSYQLTKWMTKESGVVKRQTPEMPNHSYWNPITFNDRFWMHGSLIEYEINFSKN